MKIVAIIQARMSSSRLPGKVMLDIAGQPMLVHVVERTRMAKTIDQVVVATTTDPADDSIEALCAGRGYACYRGSLFDVLDRYYQAARAYQADVIVRITADCPLIDPELIDETVCAFLGITNAIPVEERGRVRLTFQNSQIAFPYDFAANRLPPPWGRTYPVGLDVEVCSFSGLALAWSEAQQPHQREHVMPFFYDQPQRFRILHINHPVNYGALRWTVDTPQDLELVRQIFTRMAARAPERQDFSWLEVLELFESEPELARINAQIAAKDYHQVDHRRDKQNDKS